MKITVLLNKKERIIKFKFANGTTINDMEMWEKDLHRAIDALEGKSFFVLCVTDIVMDPKCTEVLLRAQRYALEKRMVRSAVVASPWQAKVARMEAVKTGVIKVEQYFANDKDWKESARSWLLYGKKPEQGVLK